MKKFIIMKRSAQTKGEAKKWKGYIRLALVEVETDKLPEGRSEPAMISNRSRGVVKVHACRDLYFGKGKNSQGKKFLDEITEKMNSLNAQNL